MILDDFLEIIPGSVNKNSKPEKTATFSFLSKLKNFSGIITRSYETYKKDWSPPTIAQYSQRTY